jgi:hypothetical protein
MKPNLNDLFAELRSGKFPESLDAANQLLAMSESANFETVLEVWQKASEIATDPMILAQADEGDPDARTAIMGANRIRVHIQQERRDIKDRLPGTFL